MKTTGLALACFVFLCFIKISVNAQTSTLKVPQNVVYKTGEDYAPYEGFIIEAAAWLENTDLDKDVLIRKDAVTFVMKWVDGTPIVTIMIEPPLLKLLDKNKDLLGIYFASYSSFCLRNKENKNPHDAVRAALQSIMNVYKKNINIVKDKDMEKLIKTDGEGKLDEFVKKNFRSA